jgi:hypothetical protein
VPLLVQYWKWVSQFAQGNFGYSLKNNQSVSSEISQYLPKTIVLVGLGLAVSLIFGIPLGVYQAVKRYTVGDYAHGRRPDVAGGGFAAALVSVLVGTLYGAFSGFIGGRIDALLMRKYVQAVKVIGGRNGRGTIIVQGTFAVADSILILTGLGFLGLGVLPPATDWGSMLSQGLNFLQSQQNYWWLIYPAGIAIIITCIAFNFIGDALRDAFETRLQRR